MAERVRIREIDDDEGNRLLRTIRRSAGSVVTWRRAQTALRSLALDGADHASHKEQGSMIRRHIIWRNRHADDTRLPQVVARASLA
jgi:hypothetical protein